MPVFEILNTEMQRIKSRAPAAFKQTVADAEKRLGILFDHLNNGDMVSPSTVDELKQVAQQIQAREHDQAAQAITEIIAAKGSEGTNWMVGVKRMVQMSRATPLG